jgi:hypothetical protein
MTAYSLARDVHENRKHGFEKKKLIINLAMASYLSQPWTLRLLPRDLCNRRNAFLRF